MVLSGSPSSDHLALLGVGQMYAADRAAIAAGTPGLALMENAGRAVADAIRQRYAPCPVVVLAGPGNNGGDGFVAARHLAAWGWPVTVALLGDQAALRGDAAAMAARWTSATVPAEPAALEGAGLVVDALFGAGLSRPLDEAARALVEAITARGLGCVAVDVPSGVEGDTGRVLGAAPRADLTVTFFRRKPAHLLFPGRRLAGEVVVAEIGIPTSVLLELGPLAYANAPALWLPSFPWPGSEDHKYSRGHAVVQGGDAASTGAARLAARAALRAGAGLVTVAAPPSALAIYAAALTAVMVRPADGPTGLAQLLADHRRNAVLVGPGNGVNATTRAAVVTALGMEKACVLDADGLTVFADEPAALFGAIRGPCILTPHEGEFARLFGRGEDLGKLARTRAAARTAQAVVVLKGGDTVIAAPDGRAAINDNAPPWLATAGTGDVLAGFCLGLLAQGMEAFAAAAAAVWLHGEVARLLGPGLIADDLAETLPRVLAGLYRL
ncbi:MAG: NAD(P)H-hydrate dehydratase [Alphaproteobacteria bacterium]|nr:NAD(P)H-hydrate dehydratase [Alphaproteobacteria bacterium]